MTREWQEMIETWLIFNHFLTNSTSFWHHRNLLFCLSGKLSNKRCKMKIIVQVIAQPVSCNLGEGRGCKSKRFRGSRVSDAFVHAGHRRYRARISHGNCTTPSIWIISTTRCARTCTHQGRWLVDRLGQESAADGRWWTLIVVAIVVSQGVCLLSVAGECWAIVNTISRLATSRILPCRSSFRMFDRGHRGGRGSWLCGDRFPA